MEQMTRYLDAETLTAEGANGISYAYRRLGQPVAAHWSCCSTSAGISKTGIPSSSMPCQRRAT